LLSILYLLNNEINLECSGLGQNEEHETEQRAAAGSECWFGRPIHKAVVIAMIAAFHAVMSCHVIAPEH